MILYIDETESEQLFIVAGVLVPSKQNVDIVFRNFKKRASMTPLPIKEKALLFKEFKSTLMDNDYPRLKKTLLSFIYNNKYEIFYSCYYKQATVFNQKEKEKTYIRLLCRIVESINQDIEIVFDSFNKKEFESRILKRLREFQNVMKIQPVNSETVSGIKIVDNICGVLRLKESKKDKREYFEIIKLLVRKV